MSILNDDLLSSHDDLINVCDDYLSFFSDSTDSINMPMDTSFITLDTITSNLNDSINIRGHSTAYKFEKNESEFKECMLTEKYIENFNAPFVEESNISFGFLLFFLLFLDLFRLLLFVKCS